MALITTRAYVVSVFDAASTSAQRTNAAATMTTRLIASGFTAPQIETYELIDAVVNTANNGPRVVDLVIARVKGVV